MLNLYRFDTVAIPPHKEICCFNITTEVKTARHFSIYLTTIVVDLGIINVA